jgi:hypothetical protein
VPPDPPSDTEPYRHNKRSGCLQRRSWAEGVVVISEKKSAEDAESGEVEFSQMINSTFRFVSPQPPSPLSSLELFLAFTYCSFIQKASSRLEESFSSIPRSKLKQIIIIKKLLSLSTKKKNLSKRQIIGVRFERQNEAPTAFAGSVTDETHTQRTRERERKR